MGPYAVGQSRLTKTTSNPTLGMPSFLHRYSTKHGRRRRHSNCSETTEDAGDMTGKATNPKSCTFLPCLRTLSEMFCPSNAKAGLHLASMAAVEDLAACSEPPGEYEKSLVQKTGMCGGCADSTCPFLAQALAAVTQEVQQGSPSSMFRGDSDAVRLVSRYARGHSTAYTRWLLGDIVQEILACAEGIDQDGYFTPSQMNNGLKRVYLSEQILPFALRLLHRFQTSQHKMPPVIRTICKHFFEAFSCKYPAFSRKESLVYTLGRFLLLRLHCPQIVQTNKGTSKLGKQILTQTARRVLVIGLGSTTDDGANPPSLKDWVIKEEAAKTVHFWQCLVKDGNGDDNDEKIRAAMRSSSRSKIRSSIYETQ
jgi:hypothetical protein